MLGLSSVRHTAALDQVRAAQPPAVWTACCCRSNSLLLLYQDAVGARTSRYWLFAVSVKR